MRILNSPTENIHIYHQIGGSLMSEVSLMLGILDTYIQQLKSCVFDLLKRGPIYSFSKTSNLDLIPLLEESPKFYLLDSQPLSNAKLIGLQSDAQIRLLDKFDLYYQSLSSSSSGCNPIHSENDFRRDAPTNVVSITITSTMVMMYSLFQQSIWRQRANAITPLTRPAYQHIFNSLSFIGNVFLVHLQSRGSAQTTNALTTGRNVNTRSPNPTANHLPEIPRTDAPRYAQTNASAIQESVQNASPVPRWDSSEIFMNVQCPIMIEHVKRVMMPENPSNSPIKQVMQPVKMIREVYLMGYLLKDSFTLRRQDSPNPEAAPIAMENTKRIKKSTIIFSTIQIL